MTSLRNPALSAAATLTALAILTGNALAVDLRVQIACAADYYAHCSAYSPDGPQVRSCMRGVGLGLSKRCLNALVAVGEVSANDIASKRSRAKTAAR